MFEQAETVQALRRAATVIIANYYLNFNISTDIHN
jgi:hypothetical protein